MRDPGREPPLRQFDIMIAAAFVLAMIADSRSSRVMPRSREHQRSPRDVRYVR